MCTRLLLLSILLIATGCTHQRSVQITESDQLAQFNAKAARQTATVVLHDGKEHTVRAVQVSPESISWHAHKSNASVSVPTHDVAEIRFRSRGSGALGGLGLGVVIGGVAGAVLGFLSGDDDPDLLLAFSAGEKAVVGGIGFGLVGGIIGLVVGTASGSTEVYRVDDRFRSEEMPQADRGRQPVGAEGGSGR